MFIRSQCKLLNTSLQKVIIEYLREAKIMNIKKFKSVAVAIETYKLLKKIAAADDRSAGMQITYLVKTRSKEKKVSCMTTQTETVMPKFKSYRKFKSEWKYERKCCNSCSREYLTDNMMCQEEGKSYVTFGTV